MTPPRKIHYALEDGIAVFTMDDGKANTMDFVWIDECEAAVAQARSDRAGAIVFRGRPGLFSGGLDLKVLPTYTPEQMQTFVRRYRKVKTDLFLLGLPIVAEAAGHALAGGSVLLLACDYVVSDASPKRIGLNETQVGIVLPAFVIAMGQARLNVAHWTRAMAAGDIYDVAGACAAGFVDEIVADAAACRATAMRHARRLAALTAGPYREVKTALRRPFVASLGDAADEGIPAFFRR